MPPPPFFMLYFLYFTKARYVSFEFVIFLTWGAVYDYVCVKAPADVNHT